MSGKHLGRIYFWDAEEEHPDDPGWENVYFVANSFSDFLRSIAIEEDDRFYSETIPIFRAIEHGDLSFLREYLATNNAYWRDDSGITVAMCAAIRRRPAALKLLLQRGSDVRAVDVHGQTLLHFAAAAHSLDCVKILLSHEVDINARDSKGETSLICAIKAGGDRVPRALVAAGADVNVVATDGETALSCCKIVAVRKTLLQAGAK